MKKLMFYFGVCLFVSFLAFSCTKNALTETQTQSEPKEEFYDGDEYDQGLVVEDPEEADEPEDIDYDADASKKTKIIKIVGSRAAPQMGVDSNCLAAKKDYTVMNGYGLAVYFDRPDTIVSITLNNSDIAIDAIDPINPIYGYGVELLLIKNQDYFYGGGNPFRAKNVKFTLKNTKNETFSFYRKLINYDDASPYPNNRGYPVFGSSIFGAYLEFYKVKAFTGTVPDIRPIETWASIIPQTFAPEKGIVLSYNADNTKLAVITTDPVVTAATATKPKKWKFKIVEWNAKCNGRRNTKSVSITDVTKIPSCFGTGFATKFYEH